jgi:DNA-binding NarL/FixJ family response regulator
MAALEELMANQSLSEPLKILVVDDHELVLHGTVNGLKQRYPDAEIATVQTAQEVKEQVRQIQPDLLVVDLSLPQTPGAFPQPDTGIQLLKTLMQRYPTLNIVVQSAYPKALVRLRSTIDTHEGGFTVASKSLSLREILTRVQWALEGVVYTPKEMRAGLELKPAWLKALQLAFEEGLQDKAIAERMNISERTVRLYWNQVQDALSVYPEAGKNIRIQTERRAREEGLID